MSEPGPGVREANEVARRLRTHHADEETLAYLLRLEDETRRLRLIAEAAADACRLREITPYLIQRLCSEGYETQPAPPDPDEWTPAEQQRYRQTIKDQG